MYQENDNSQTDDLLNSLVQLQQYNLSSIERFQTALSLIDSAARNICDSEFHRIKNNIECCLDTNQVVLDVQVYNLIDLAIRELLGQNKQDICNNNNNSMVLVDCINNNDACNKPYNSLPIYAHNYKAKYMGNNGVQVNINNTTESDETSSSSSAKMHPYIDTDTDIAGLAQNNVSSFGVIISQNSIKDQNGKIFELSLHIHDLRNGFREYKNNDSELLLGENNMNQCKPKNIDNDDYDISSTDPINKKYCDLCEQYRSLLDKKKIEYFKKFICEHGFVMLSDEFDEEFKKHICLMI